MISFKFYIAEKTHFEKMVCHPENPAIVITRREAEDYKLVGGHVIPEIPEIGQEFQCEVVSAYPPTPAILGREATEWRIATS